MKESIWRRVAWKLPRALVYWCVIRALVHATTKGQWARDEPDSLSPSEILKRWGQPGGPPPPSHPNCRSLHVV